MNRGPFIFLGVFFALALAWYGMIVGPQLQLGMGEQVAAGPARILYPVVRPGFAEQGKEIYRAQGCYYCHTRQVLPKNSSADMERNWGPRFSVAQDYLTDRPLMLGSIRVGPDLANIGARMPASFAAPWNLPPGTNNLPDLTDWHLKHLYNPKITSPGSTMPPYPFLFEKIKRKKGSPPHPDALRLPDLAESDRKGDYVFDVVPKKEASLLVDYLMSLRADMPLFEAPIPPPPGSEGDTNQPAGGGAATNTASPSAGASNPAAPASPK